MKRKKWYGVYGFNGLGIYTDYQRLLDARVYIRGIQIKSFPNREEAEDFARDGFIRLNGADMLFSTVPEEKLLRSNYCYFRDRNRKKVELIN